LRLWYYLDYQCPRIRWWWRLPMLFKNHWLTLCHEKTLLYLGW
jgi:hypothetical protein